MSDPTFRKIFERRGDIGVLDPFYFWRLVSLPVRRLIRVSGEREWITSMESKGIPPFQDTLFLSSF